MASLGITDALNAIVVVYNLAVKLKAEGKELAAIAKKIKRAKDHLTQVKLRIENPKHPFGQGNAEMCVLLV